MERGSTLSDSRRSFCGPAFPAGPASTGITTCGLSGSVASRSTPLPSSGGVEPSPDATAAAEAGSRSARQATCPIMRSMPTMAWSSATATTPGPMAAGTIVRPLRPNRCDQSTVPGGTGALRWVRRDRRHAAIARLGDDEAIADNHLFES